MANNEGVDIIIKATDQYTKTINNITASNDLFGKSVKNIEKEIATLENYMIKLVANGMNPASGAVKLLQGNLDQLKGTLTQTQNAAKGAGDVIGGSSLKEANKKWTSLALVVQDLPYGFRGIQNNLPALFGSIAAAAGPAYFAFSALVALVTAYEKELKALFVTTTAAEKQQELLNNVVKESGSAYVDAQTQVLSLTQKVKLAKEGYIDKQGVIDEYNKTIGETIGQQKTLEGVNQALINQGPAYVDYMNKLAMAVAASKLVAQETENIIKTSAKSASEFVSGFEAFFSGKLNLGGIVQSMIASSQAALVVAQKNKKFQLNTAIQTKDGYVKIMEDMYKAAGEAAKKAGVKPGVDPNAKKDVKPTVNKYYENLAQEEFNYYKDSIFRAEEYFNKLNNIQKINALMEATIKGASADELFAIQQTYDQKALNFQQAQQSRIFEVLHQGQQANKKLTDDYNKERIDGEVKYTDNYIAALEAQLKAQMRLNKNNVALQQENVKNQLKQLYFAQVFSAGNVKSLELINAAILKLKGNLTGLGDVSTAVSSILSSSLQATFEGIGQSLGELVTTGKFNFGVLGTILADALIGIGKALILYSSLVQAAKKAIESGKVKAGLILGIAAVAAGFALKASMNKKRNTGAKEFANGGIISGPTYGLMGEYPGAASNPEVVAPLDKLKSLMGGAGGTLEARISGNDLLILMNKAGRNNQNTF
jgi:hypothetical protein